MKKLTAEVAVIGGGAAGMMAAIWAARSGARVLLIERNKFVGRKLGITGKGRCNVTNNCTVREVIENVTKNSKFLYSSLTAFDPVNVMNFFETCGVALKTERGRRVFPASDRAADIVNALRKACREAGVQIFEGRVSAMKTAEGELKAVCTEDTEIECRSAIICTGGVSYPATGSTGDGYVLAKSVGHSVTQLCPSLVPLESEDEVCADLTGLTLKNVTLSVTDSKNRTVYSELGEMLFTHFGLTGPLILSASSHMHDYGNTHYTVHIDMKPGLTAEELDNRILRDFTKYANRDIANGLTDLLHKRMITHVLKKSGIASGTKVNIITRQQRHALIDTIKNFTVSISGPRPIEEAVVTCGGVNVKEIDPSSMQSKLMRGLYFAGEVIDVDAYTGGYNLQIAWSTGKSAGIHAAQYAMEEKNEY